MIELSPRVPCDHDIEWDVMSDVGRECASGLLEFDEAYDARLWIEVQPADWLRDKP